MNLKIYIRVVLASVFIVCCAGQSHMLKIINTGGNSSPSSPAQFSSLQPTNSQSNVKNRFSNVDRICVTGMWALYNTTFWGEGAEDSTTVISIRGTDINTCTQRGQIPVLKNVQSLKYLGNSDYNENGMLIYSQPYLLGGYWNVTMSSASGTPETLPDTISGFPLGSIAITGTSSWIICADRETPCLYGVCVNMLEYGKLFLQRNAVKDFYKGVNVWPRTVRSIQLTTPTDCANYPSPPPLNQKRLFKRSALEGVEVSVDTP